MKAVKLTEPSGTISHADVDRPAPGPGEILVRMEASGLCYTDAPICDDDWAISQSSWPGSWAPGSWP